MSPSADSIAQNPQVTDTPRLLTRASVPAPTAVVSTGRTRHRAQPAPGNPHLDRIRAALIRSHAPVRRGQAALLAYSAGIFTGAAGALISMWIAS